MTKKQKKQLLIGGGILAAAGLVWYFTRNQGAANVNAQALNDARANFAATGVSTNQNAQRLLTSNSMPASSMPQANSVANFADSSQTGYTPPEPVTTVKPVTVTPLPVQPVPLAPQNYMDYLTPALQKTAYSAAQAKQYLQLQAPISTV